MNRHEANQAIINELARRLNLRPDGVDKFSITIYDSEDIAKAIIQAEDHGASDHERARQRLQEEINRVGELLHEYAKTPMGGMAMALMRRQLTRAAEAIEADQLPAIRKSIEELEACE